MACQYKRYMEKTVRIQKTERSSSWDCQNTAIVVGELAAELRQYNCPRKLLQRFVRISDHCPCFVFVWTAVLAHLLTPHIGWLPTQASFSPDFCIVHCSQAVLGRKRHFKYQTISSSCALTCLLRVSLIATSVSLYRHTEPHHLIRQ